MSIDSKSDLEGMRRVGRVVGRILAEMRAAVRVGMTTRALDEVAAAAFRRHGARSAPQFTYGFPGFSLLSVNEQIVHGVPGERRLQSGDVLKIDVTAEMGGYIADAARTVLVGAAAPQAVRLRACARGALSDALSVARAGRPVSAIGRAVETRARRDGFAVLRELCGHGVGRTIHEPPDVPNYENRSAVEQLTDGLVIAIEPMLSAGHTSVVLEADGWTIRTADRSVAVHEEQTVVIRHGAPLVLTAEAA
jgi:methionyl aminopeptidase